MTTTALIRELELLPLADKLFVMERPLRDAHPGATVVALGSTEARTRLHRMGIANNLEAIERDFTVFGLAGEG